jgi:hypothetical protein
MMAPAPSQLTELELFLLDGWHKAEKGRREAKGEADRYDVLVGSLEKGLLRNEEVIVQLEQEVAELKERRAVLEKNFQDLLASMGGLPPPFEPFVAERAHALNLTLCEHLGLPVGHPWHELDGGHRVRIISAVGATSRATSPQESHQRWMDSMAAMGWGYGPVRSEEAKTHECMLPFGQLSRADQLKDHVFLALVKLAQDMHIYYRSSQE